MHSTRRHVELVRATHVTLPGNQRRVLQSTQLCTRDAHGCYHDAAICPIHVIHHAIRSPNRSPPTTHPHLLFAASCIDHKHVSMQIGDEVELHSLVTRAGLNGSTGTLVYFDSDADRWQVALTNSLGGVRARSINIRRDRIELYPPDGPSLRVMRSRWQYPDNADRSAQHILTTYMKGQMLMSFAGNILIHTTGSPPRSFKPPTVLTILETGTRLWDTETLLNSIRSSVPSSVTVRDVCLPWTTPSEQTFLSSINAMILRAHSTSDIAYVAVRTNSNTPRFGILHALSGENTDIQRLLLNKGTVLCSPTEAIVYHKDNMVKLPTSMTLLQATRKVTDMILHGSDTPCPICLEPPSAEMPTVFVPCECKAPIHLSCLRLLYENRKTECPLCRTALGSPDMR